MAITGAVLAESFVVEIDFLNEEFNVPQFDPALGMLQRVEISLVSYTTMRSYVFDNDNPNSLQANVELSARVNISGNGSALTNIDINHQTSVFLDGNDGDGNNTQNGGTDEETLDLPVSLSAPVSVTNAARLPAHVGTGTVAYRVYLSQLSIHAEEGVEWDYVSSSASGRIRVTCVYEPAASIPWVRKEIPVTIDHMCYGESTLLGYTFGEDTRIISSGGTVVTNLGYAAATILSEDGVSWIEGGAPPAGSIALGYNGQGRWYGFVKDSYYNGYSTTAMLN